MTSLLYLDCAQRAQITSCIIINGFTTFRTATLYNATFNIGHLIPRHFIPPTKPCDI